MATNAPQSKDIMSDLITQDPHGVIPVGWKFGGNYEVVGFVDPVGRGILETMVAVKYPNYQENCWGYSTTQDYIYVLRDYLSTVDSITLEQAKSEWRKKKLVEWARQNPTSALAQSILAEHNETPF
jgi:hypothetical protein